MTKQQKEDFIKYLFAEAKSSNHPFPEYSVFEGILETGWGQSKLFKEGWNVFGLKQSKSNPRFETLTYPTKEFLDGKWVTVSADFISYPTIKDSFNDRTNTLIRLSSTYKEYKDALNARTGEEFVREVSSRWSTSPTRAEDVLKIYNQYKYIFEEKTNEVSVSEKLSDFWTNFKNRFKK